MTQPTLNPALREFWTTPARNRVLYGGRSSSKSWDAAGFAVFLASNFKVRFLCARQFQNKIAESVYTLLKIQIARFGLDDDFEITRDSIRHKRTGSEFLFYGLWRHIDEIKSLEGIDVCWIEEAHGLTKEQWEILEPTLRGEASQFWIIFNPKLVTDFVYRTFVTGTPSTRIKGEIYGVVGDTIKRRINYDENPFLTKTMLRVIAKKKQTDPEGFVNIYGGEPIEDDDQVIIKRSWIRAAIDAHKKLGIKPTGRRRIGFDVADSGEDKNALVEAYGILTVDVEEWAGGEDELLKSATRVHARARQVSAEIDYDSIGVGAFAGGHFQALNQSEGTSIEYRKFNASGEVLNKGQRIDANDDNSPLNEDFYCNLKAQAWWEAATRFRNTFNAVERQMSFPEEELIAISSDCDHLEDLIDELSTPRKDVDTRGKSKVESKKDLAKREIASPNKADAFIMANGPRDASTYDLGSLL
ncbi:PBSX family phage terminase large subunit [Shimia sagamensis]|uniref:Phage terminase large subunit n=1 Tax=Shimia sagamensis TaxID=1566352 RepID=A0ABY1PN21_9RHOB|nr:PBSX family phage terminase large subunit [Shimia sagamensis]SMP36960.1 phage terminase large subunit [Shimia sagamensis]